MTEQGGGQQTRPTTAAGGERLVAERQRKGRRSGLLVVTSLVLVGVVAGVLAYRNLVASEARLSTELAVMEQRGEGLDVPGCVDAVMDWHDECAVMKSLCDQTVPRFMHVCLAARDRTEFCDALGPRSSDTSFGFDECKARGGDRDDKKACAVVYRVIDGHCKDVRGES